MTSGFCLISFWERLIEDILATVHARQQNVERVGRREQRRQSCAAAKRRLFGDSSSSSFSPPYRCMSRESSDWIRRRCDGQYGDAAGRAGHPIVDQALGDNTACMCQVGLVALCFDRAARTYPYMGTGQDNALCDIAIYGHRPGRRVL